MRDMLEMKKPFYFKMHARDDALGFVAVDYNCIGIHDAQFRSFLTVITTLKTRMHNTSHAGFTDSHTRVYARALQRHVPSQHSRVPPSRHTIVL